MNVTVCGPNLNDQSKGQFHVHAAGCHDLNKNVRREPEYRNGWTIEADSVRSVVEDVYSDFIFNNDQDPWSDFVNDLHFFPCCSHLPMEVEQEADLDDPYFDDIQATLHALVAGLDEVKMSNRKRDELVGEVRTLSKLIGVPIEQD